MINVSEIFFFLLCHKSLLTVKTDDIGKRLKSLIQIAVHMFINRNVLPQMELCDTIVRQQEQHVLEEWSSTQY